jgi:WS/DGAT/MGAT family acyltransferase
LRRLIDTSMAGNPRFRQRLAYVPLLQHPVWVDDERFDLDSHLHFTSLQRPGNDRQLKQLAGRLMSERLAPGKPLWEIWFVDGLADRRVALIAKFHHCMIDGMAGIDILASILRLDQGRALPEPQPWTARAAPSGARLLVDELARRATVPLDALRSAPDLLRDPRHGVDSIRTVLHDLGEATGANFTPASPTPLNVAVGPRRHVDWTCMDLAIVKEIKQLLGGSVNDVVLTVLAGAVGGFLRRKGASVGELDFRLTMPVNVRASGEHVSGNHVAVLSLPLPVAERDSRRRLQTIIESTSQIKGSGQLHGIELLSEFSDRLFPPLAGWLAWAAARARMYNLSITNMPGPQIPVYLLGAPMVGIYPLAFLFSHQALTVAVLSYNKKLYWTLTADPDVLPSLRGLVKATEQELARLHKAATARSEGAIRL